VQPQPPIKYEEGGLEKGKEGQRGN
jgi:hypothetical protein